jgi:hypothetical protein
MVDQVTSWLVGHPETVPDRSSQVSLDALVSRLPVTRSERPPGDRTASRFVAHMDWQRQDGIYEFLVLATELVRRACAGACGARGHGLGKVSRELRH